MGLVCKDASSMVAALIAGLFFSSTLQMYHCIDLLLRMTGFDAETAMWTTGYCCSGVRSLLLRAVN